MDPAGVMGVPGADGVRVSEASTLSVFMTCGGFFATSPGLTSSPCFFWLNSRNLA
jgi:hypothetical protein